MKNRNITLSLIGFTSTVIYLINASWLASWLGHAQTQNRQTLAHRGMHQNFDPRGVTNDTCTAVHMEMPRHGYLENTIASMKEARRLGADIIELDIHPTSDGDFMVFHDWTLECRTDGKGITREQTSAYLKTLDIGYGYTADGGNTYPFREKFVGAMPSLSEVFETFPNASFLINMKSRRADEARALTQYLKNRPDLNRANLSVYGSGASTAEFTALNPDIMTMSKAAAKTCLKSYVLTGWSGYIPKPCRNSYVPVPVNYQWAIWGFPNQFEARLAKYNSRVVLLGPHKKGKANSGIDSKAAYQKVPKDFGGIIWTNRVDLIGEIAVSPARP